MLRQTSICSLGQQMFSGESGILKLDYPHRFIELKYSSLTMDLQRYSALRVLHPRCWILGSFIPTEVPTLEERCSMSAASTATFTWRIRSLPLSVNPRWKPQKVIWMIHMKNVEKVGKFVCPSAAKRARFSTS